ncbi:beta-L-arabinofuranosidase domain-containing protein [Metabacillus dongyingensis]|uniref:glycoside hydrolase family 127 protein n=1 Tax=Metabacillus dongyingensis TaxID=2874282 RepID=UPI003B8CEE5D
MRDTMKEIKHHLEHWEGISFTKVKIEDDFWRPRLESLKNVTLKACLDKCETTGRISNFAKAAGLLEGKHEGIYFDDSDVYKLIEGAAYSLMSSPDIELETEIDRIVDLIAAAQENDGYLCTYFTLEAPDKKWTDMEKHEMYCGGHLMEAAIAFYEATGKKKLLDVAQKLADHYDRLFGPGKRHWVEGHEEIELALVKLYRITGEDRYWKLALWLLEERGNGHGSGMIWERDDWGPAYCQDDVPVKEIKTVKGHAVRAMYLYTAMADVVHASGNQEYIVALNSVWENIVQRNMYITGGIGPSKQNEGFTKDYDLPNESAYCETCASIGMVLWNHRMNLLFADAKYADVVERSMYNGALAGISFSGDKFFYVNPLASKGDHHRIGWFDVSCCPTNLARFLPSVGNYVYAKTDNGFAVNLYMNSSSVFTIGTGVVRVEQKTDYPWKGNVEMSINPEKEETFSLKARIPGWCRGFRVWINGKSLASAEIILSKGYVNLDRNWKKGDRVTLELDMPVEIVRARHEVEEDRALIALQRGPLVYCIEQVDNQHLDYNEMEFSSDEQVVIEHEREIFNGITLLASKDAQGRPCTFIPYYAWDNREPGFMQVWVREASNQSLYKF